MMLLPCQVKEIKIYRNIVQQVLLNIWVLRLIDASYCSLLQFCKIRMIFNEAQNQCLLVMRWSESIPSTCDSFKFLANQMPAKVAKICAKKTINELQEKVSLLAEMKK